MSTVCPNDTALNARCVATGAKARLYLNKTPPIFCLVFCSFPNFSQKWRWLEALSKYLWTRAAFLLPWLEASPDMVWKVWLPARPDRNSSICSTHFPFSSPTGHFRCDLNQERQLRNQGNEVRMRFAHVVYPHYLNWTNYWLSFGVFGRNGKQPFAGFCLSHPGLAPQPLSTRTMTHSLYPPTTERKFLWKTKQKAWKNSKNYI